MYQFLADVVLTFHVLLVAFIVLGLVLILMGWLKHWAWVRNRRFRSLHLAAIGVVAAQAWVGMICPLTSLEMWLRSLAGDTRYEGSFIQHWLQRLLYYNAPDWVFLLAYSVFGLLVLLSWWCVRPERKQRE